MKRAIAQRSELFGRRRDEQPVESHRPHHARADLLVAAPEKVSLPANGRDHDGAGSALRQRVQDALLGRIGADHRPVPY